MAEAEEDLISSKLSALALEHLRARRRLHNLTDRIHLIERRMEILRTALRLVGDSGAETPVELSPRGAIDYVEMVTAVGERVDVGEVARRLEDLDVEPPFRYLQNALGNAIRRSAKFEPVDHRPGLYLRTAE